MSSDQNPDSWITDWEFSERYPVYTRANAGEVLPDPSSPLNVTLVWNKGLNIGWREGYVEHLGTHLASEIDEEMPEIIGNFGGYHYTNFSMTELNGARLPGLTVPVWNSLWVGDHPDIPEYVEKPGHQNAELTAGLAEKTAWSLTTDTFPEAEEAKHRADLARANRPDVTAMSDQALVDHARSFVPDLIFCYAYHPVTTTLSTMGPAVAGALLESIGEADKLGDLLSGLGGVDSAEPSYALWSMGRLVAGSAELTALFDDGLATLLEAIDASGTPDAKQFRTDFDDFLYKYGSRAPNEWDIRSDSWESKPVLALLAVNGMRMSPTENDPELIRERNQAKRIALTAELAAKMPDDATRQSFLDAAKSITKFMPWRERTKTACVKVMGEMRTALYELGHRMVDRGVMGDHHDVTMLLDDELDAFVADPESFVDTIADRREQYLALFDLEPPFFLFEKIPLSQWPRRTEHKAQIAVPGDALSGVGGAPGVSRGRARILHDPYEVGDLAEGDIIVAPQTDPAWTPLFVFAGGVVVNVGATITHSSIVCRELGIPCAVSVQDATSRIPDGAMIEVDGNTGTVTVL
ncbi:PEP-utilizing enzyme [Rhodococcoides fascians]|uniref:PEP-utilizing enzyme n=1 Tax=Rhodococcoides fascians TaxID=1828 RepID=UPI00050D057B|nr:PEP-utilizing enzyme [Rhodococcus fascians]